MINHFHLLVHVVPRDDSLTDAELVERVRALYGDPDAKVAASYLESEEKGPEFRQALVARIGDVSTFLKELKPRFSYRTGERAQQP